MVYIDIYIYYIYYIFIWHVCFVQGHFACGACGLPLYSAESKFRSNCGWPVFKTCYYSKALAFLYYNRSMMISFDIYIYNTEYI